MKQKAPIRTITLAGAVAIGIGGMVGGGIFAVLGEAVSLAHGATFVAFLIAGVVALLTAYSYAKLSVALPNRGGTVTFVDRAFQKNLLSGSVNLMLWMSYLVTISLYATAFAYYGGTFFSEEPTFWVHHGLITFAIILPMLINLVSASFVSRTETLFVFMKVFLLLLVVISGFFFVDPERLSPKQWEAPLAIVTAGMIIFVAYEGFELIANAAEDIIEPAKNLPRAFYASVLIVIFLYVTISIVTVGVVDESKMMAAKDYALAIAAEPALGKWGFTLVAVAALLSTFSAINATIYGNARLGYKLAKNGRLPRSLGQEKRHIPGVGVLVTSVLSIALANSITLTDIAIIGSAGFLLIFFIVNVSAYRMREFIGANAFVTVMALVLSALALVTLLYHTYSHNPLAIVVFTSFVVISILFEFFYGRLVRGHFFQRSY